MGKRSLQQRLLILLLGSVATLWLIFGLFIQDEVKHEAEEVFDANLVQTSKLLRTLAQGELNKQDGNLTDSYPLDEINQQFHLYEHKVAFQIIDLNGNTLLQSPHAPEQNLSTQSGTFQTRLIDGQLWRTFSLPHPQAVIHVGELLEVRNEIAEEITEYLFQLALISLPILALLIWWSVRWGLSPISTITENLTQRDSRHLNELEIGRAPKELKPLIQALNRLFSLLQHSINKERRFTADAAHELRTPLAAIKIHAQVARNEVDQQRRSHALEQIIHGVDRTTHLTEQLLALARIDGIQELDSHATTLDLKQVVNENLEMLRQRAINSKIELHMVEPMTTPLQICGNRELVSTLLRNLIDNAIRYTPNGGRVSVQLEAETDATIIRVRDTGPGIPNEIQERIFERFYRNNSSKSGSGLGLSISQQIVEIHGGSITLNNCSNPDGLEVTLTFPSALRNSGYPEDQVAFVKSRSCTRKG